MNIDELVVAIKATSSEKVVQRLGDILLDWKKDETTVEDLRNLIEHYIGNTWITSDTVHSSVYQLWSTFRDDAILGVGGMTVNERLYCFGLFTQFDQAQTDNARKSIYNKVLARA